MEGSAVSVPRTDCLNIPGRATGVATATQLANTAGGYEIESRGSGMADHGCKAGFG